MNKFVYLYELDSVCNNREEIAAIIDIYMYKTIVLDGDILVLSFNQLTDSTLFMSIIANDKMRNVFVWMLKSGRIRISKYFVDNKLGKPMEISNATRYVLHQIDKQIDSGKCSFIFSSLNSLYQLSDGCKAKVLKSMRKALEYNDLETFEARLRNISGKNGSSLNEADIIFLKKYLRFIIEISYKNIQYRNIKKGVVLQLSDCVEIALRALHDDVIFDPLNKLYSHMKTKHKDKIQSRSEWYGQNSFPNRGTREGIELIIDVCYNMAVESSISGVFSVLWQYDDEKYFYDKYTETGNRYDTYEHVYYCSAAQPTGVLFEFNKESEKYWGSAVRVLEDLPMLPSKSWAEIAKCKRLCYFEKLICTFLFTLVILILVSSLIDCFISFIASLINCAVLPFEGYSCFRYLVLLFLLPAISVLLGDIVGYKANIKNLAEVALDPEMKSDFKTLSNIAKYRFYSKPKQEDKACQNKP